jgi:hypothetical protein
MKLVIVESPFAGDVATNIRYARACVRDSLWRDESPYASHLFFPQVLDDEDRGARIQGIAAGLAWGEKADLVAVYTDLGVSVGMAMGIEAADRRGTPITWRTLGANWASVDNLPPKAPDRQAAD